MAGWHHHGGRVGRNLELAPEYKLLRHPHEQWRASFRDLDALFPLRLGTFSHSPSLSQRGKKDLIRGEKAG